MDRITGTLQVFFEDPFWVGYFERISQDRLSVCKVTFGPEPKDCDIYEFVLKKYDQLQFSPAVAAAAKKEKKNPKRILREVHRQTEHVVIGTKSQQALQLQHEQRKIEKKLLGREQKEAEKERQFELKQQKKKEKHRGR